MLTTNEGGALLGAGLFTFDYGEGLSYFGTDPKNCMNCHIMREQFAAAAATLSGVM